MKTCPQKFKTFQRYKTATIANRVRSLIRGVIANKSLFHSDQGYDWILAQIERVDIELKNPQVAARMATAFEIQTRLEPEFQTKIQTKVKNLLATKTDQLKPETKEILSKVCA